VRNTITNLTTQDEQVACFQNVAVHLEPGGCFVIEVYIPELRRLPPGETVHAFTVTPTHLGLEEYDVAAQIAVSHHYWVVDDQLETYSTPHRYLWPSELDLMARLAGMTLRERWSDWTRAPLPTTAGATCRSGRSRHRRCSLRREITDDQGHWLPALRRLTGSVVTWRRAQMVRLSAHGRPIPRPQEQDACDATGSGHKP
jgi:hypothetical protein